MLEYVLLAIIIFLTGLYSTWIFNLVLPNRSKTRAYAQPVSIIVPAHNEEKYIRKTLENLISEDYDKKEIIVVDDGSTDATANIVKEFSNRGVRLLRTDHLGKSAALNKGLSRSRYGIIVTLDADSEIKKGSISELVKPLRSGKVGAVTGVIRARRTKNPLTWFQDYEYMMSSSWRYACTNINGNSIVPGFAAFRKDALKKIGGFSKDTLTEDFDIVMSLSRAGYKTLTIKTASITTNVPQTFRSLIRQRLRWGSGTIQVMRKHSGFILSRDSGSLGYFTIPNQFYWYIHAFVYLPIILYMMLFVWSRGVVAANGFFSLEFVRHLFVMFSVYGIFDLLIKVVTGEYAASIMILLTLVLFFLSFAYALLVFAKIARPDIRVIVAYVFFFPYGIFNLFVLGVSALRAITSPYRRNKWN